MENPANTPHIPPEDARLRFIGGGYYSAPRGQDFPFHRHKTWEMVYYLSGNPLCPVKDSVFDGTPGTLIATPPQTPHAELARTPYTNLYFTVDAPADMPWATAVQDENRDLEETCRAILRESQRPDAYSESIVRALLLRFDLLLRRATEKKHDCVTPGEYIVRSAERIIGERYSERGFRVAHLATLVGAAPSTLRDAFHRCRNRSAQQTLADTRVRQALSYLRQTDMTLDVIAMRCGFDSASHLSRHVRNETGVGPGKLRSPEGQHVPANRAGR